MVLQNFFAASYKFNISSNLYVLCLKLPWILYGMRCLIVLICCYSIYYIIHGKHLFCCCYSIISWFCGIDKAVIAYTYYHLKSNQFKKSLNNLQFSCAKFCHIFVTGMLQNPQNRQQLQDMLLVFLSSPLHWCIGLLASTTQFITDVWLSFIPVFVLFVL